MRVKWLGLPRNVCGAVRKAGDEFEVDAYTGHEALNEGVAEELGVKPPAPPTLVESKPVLPVKGEKEK